MKISKKIIITVIILIIAILCTLYLMSQYKDNGLKNVNTNLLQIQAKVKNIKEKSVMENNNEVLIGQVVPEELSVKFNLNSMERIRILTLEDLNMLGLSNINEDLKYIVNYDSGEVYYIDGFKDEKGNTYYKLSDMNAITSDDD